MSDHADAAISLSTEANSQHPYQQNTVPYTCTAQQMISSLAMHVNLEVER